MGEQKSGLVSTFNTWDTNRITGIQETVLGARFTVTTEVTNINMGGVRTPASLLPTRVNED